VIIWPVEVENAKMCFRPSGETTATTEGDAATESAERMSYLTRVSLMREAARPSYPIIWTPEALTNTNIVVDWTMTAVVQARLIEAANEQSQWAVCATSAVQGGELDSAQEDYAALSLIDRVMFLGRVKKMKSPTARNAMVAVLRGRVGEAEEILIQGGASSGR
jgi:hypothetical protein